jgi:hypothetical protein
VVFSSPKAELDLHEPTITVLVPSKLKAYVRAPIEKTYLNPEQRRALVEIFDQEVERLGE